MLAAALLLPPLMAAAVIAAAFIPEWIRTRSPWYIVLFNAANFVGPALAARAVFDLVSTGGAGAWTLAALAAVATFLVVQYTVLAIMLKLARGVSIRDTVRADCVLIDAGLLSLGALGAALAEGRGAIAEAPEPLRDYVGELESPPFEVDHDLIELGARALLRHGVGYALEAGS